MKRLYALRKWVVCIPLIIANYAFAINIVYWDGNSPNQNWTTPANWAGDVLPTSADLAIVNSGAWPMPVINSSTQVHDIYVTRYQTSGNASVTMDSGTVDIVEILRLNESGATGTTASATFNMNGGTINIGFLPGATVSSSLQVSLKGDAVFNMNDGTVNVAKSVKIHPTESNNGSGILNLIGGTINADGLEMTSKSHLDITGGLLVLNGDKRTAIQDYINSGLITAYNGTKPCANIVVSFDSVADQTTVKAVVLESLGADLTCDYVVNEKDLSVIAQNWLNTGPDVAGDLVKDGIIDFKDFAILGNSWLQESWPPSSAMQIEFTQTGAIFNLPAAIPPGASTEVPFFIAENSTKYFFSTNCSISCDLKNGKSVLTDSDAFDLQTDVRASVSNRVQESDPPTIQNNATWWRRIYYGTFSAHKVYNNSLQQDCYVGILHGENKNWTNTSIGRFYDNTILWPQTYLWPDQYSGYVYGAWVEYWPCYFGFVCLTYGLPGNSGNLDWLMQYDMGPIVWPSGGYLDVNDNRIGAGPRHPYSIFHDGYFYVFYQDGSGNGNFKVARAITDNLWEPTAYKVFYQGAFNNASLPQGFNRDHPSLFYRTKGAPSTGIIPTRAERFTVAKITGTPYFLGLETRNTTQGGGNYFWVSSNLTDWYNSVQIPPGGDQMTYGIMFNKDFTSNQIIDANDFYVVSGAKSGYGSLPALHVGIKLRQVSSQN